MARPDELTFAPLGGVGEIGMNLSIYGLGNRHQRSWLAVDLGVSFGDEEHLPGYRSDHARYPLSRKGAQESHRPRADPAHEDHFGAIVDLWPKLKCPIYATKFSAALFEAKCASERNPPKIPVTVVPSGGRIDLGPFSVEFIRWRIRFRNRTRSRSIPLPARAAYRRLEDRSDADHSACPPTNGGCASSGMPACWRWSAIPPTPCGRALAVGGRSRKTIIELVKAARGRVAVTTFASNVARLRASRTLRRRPGARSWWSAAPWSAWCRWRAKPAIFNGVQSFRGADLYGHFPPDKVLALCTGSPGRTARRAVTHRQ